MFGNFNHLTIAESLKIDHKLNALQKITNGEVDERYFETLNDDWDIEERSQAALQYWGLADFGLTQKLDALSGGKRPRSFLQESRSTGLISSY